MSCEDGRGWDNQLRGWSGMGMILAGTIGDGDNIFVPVQPSNVELCPRSTAKCVVSILK